jgi:hypothetical protein
MSDGIPIPPELFLTAIARGVCQFLESRPDLQERIVEKVAELQAELLTAEKAAASIGVTKRRLGEKHKEWGLTKSTRFGPKNPVYFLSQILAEAHTQEIKGRVRCAQPEGAKVVSFSSDVGAGAGNNARPGSGRKGVVAT